MQKNDWGHEKVRLTRSIYHNINNKTIITLIVYSISFREEMVAMMQELKDKQERSQVLLEEVSKLPRNINR